MYARLKRLYDTGKIDETGLNNAVLKGWITAAERDQIIAGD